MIDVPVWVYALAAQGLALAAAWGDIRRQITNNRERQDERHHENHDVLNEIRDDVKRINGTVAQHGQQLRSLEREVYSPGRD
jgi:hypothetical protein